MSFVMGLAFIIAVIGVSVPADLVTAFGTGAFLAATLGRNWDS